MSRQRIDGGGRTVSMAMVPMHQRMPLASRDQPAVDGKCRHPGQDQGQGQTPPEQRIRQTGIHRAGNHHHDRIIYQLNSAKASRMAERSFSCDLCCPSTIRPNVRTTEKPFGLYPKIQRGRTRSSRHSRPNEPPYEPPSCPLSQNHYTCISDSLLALRLSGSATAAEKVLIYTIETCLTEIHSFIVFLDEGVACRMEVFAFS